MAMNRIRAVWSGFIGGPGVSTFYSTDVTNDLPRIYAFFNALVSMLPLAVSIQVENAGDIIDETTGRLIGSWIGSVQPPVQGTTGGAYSAPTGLVVNWETGVVQDGSRLRGKTFIVPAAGTAFADNGTLNDSARENLRVPAAALAAAGSLVVWHRPRAARPADGSRPAVTARAGGYASLSGATVADRAAVLRSRRD